MQGGGLASPALITKALANTLGAVAPAIDSTLYGLLSTLGVRLGEADIRDRSEVPAGRAGPVILIPT